MKKWIVVLFTLLFTVLGFSLFATDNETLTDLLPKEQPIKEHLSRELVQENIFTEDLEQENTEPILQEQEQPQQADTTTDESQIEENKLDEIFTEEIEQEKIDSLYSITENLVKKYENLFKESLEITEFSAKQKDGKYKYIFFTLNGKEVHLIYQGSVKNYQSELNKILSATVSGITSSQNNNSPKISSSYNVFISATGNLDIGDIVLVPNLNGGISSYVVTQKRKIGDDKISLLTPLYVQEKPVEGVSITRKKKPISFDSSLNVGFIDEITAGADICIKYPLFYPFSVLAGIRANYAIDKGAFFKTHFGAIVGAECQISLAKLFERKLPFSAYTRFDFSTSFYPNESKVDFASDFELGLRWHLSPLSALHTGARLNTIPGNLTNIEVPTFTIGFSQIL